MTYNVFGGTLNPTLLLLVFALLKSAVSNDLERPIILISRDIERCAVSPETADLVATCC